MENILTIPQLDLVNEKLELLNQKFDYLIKEKSINENQNLSRYQAAKMLNICVTTLDTHRKHGLIKGFKLGRKRLYKLSEINELGKILKHE